MEKPVDVGSIVEELVVDISHEGKAVIKVDGFTIFADDGVIGDRIEAEIVEMRRNFALAKCLNILEESEDRRESLCPVAKDCGGCQLQELNYEAELKFKTDMLRSNLIKIGGLDDIEILPIKAMEEPYRYRNNVQIPIGHRDGQIVIGHYEKKSHRIVDTEECFIQEEVADKIVRVLRKFMRENSISSYNKKRNKGLMKHIVIRTARKTKDTMVILVSNEEEIPKLDELLEELKSIEEVKSIYQNFNFGRTKHIMSNSSNKLYGEDYIIDYIGERKFKISPESFFQTNTDQAKVLYDLVLDFADPRGDEMVIDLFSGIGTISLYIADKVDYVYGVESFAGAVKDARKNASLNGIENVSFLTGRAEDILPQLETGGTDPDLIIVDPPRRGCEEELLETMISMNPEKIVYVSCNPSTLARDLEYLLGENYQLKKIQPVDMFPQTTHVECIALIQRKTI